MSANGATSVAQSRVPLAAISKVVPAILFGVTAISLPLAAAQSFGLSTRETALHIVALYGIPSVLCIVLTLIY